MLVGLAGPQRHQGQRHRLPGPGRPQRRQRLLERLDHQLRAQLSDNARQLTAIDIVAHENGHGIFHTTPGGSSGDNETGGMNEATGDIFGALTEAYAANPNDPADFLVGEEANLVGDGPIRNMYNPSALGDPNCYSTSHPEHRGARRRRPAEPLVLPAVAGLERLAGLSPTCNGSTVTGVGIQTAGKIFYNGLLLKTSSWTHGTARKATLPGRGQPLRHHQLHQLQHGQGRLGRDLGAGAVGRGHLRWRRRPDPAATCTETTATGTTSTGLLGLQAVLVRLQRPRPAPITALPDRADRRRLRPLPAAVERLLVGRTSRPVRARRRPRRSRYNAGSGTYRWTSTATRAPARSR